MWLRLRTGLASRTVKVGAILYLGMRWFDRLLGLISTVVLARLLSPEDFGLIALAMTVIGLAAVLLDMGINIALIQRKELSKGDIDTAWTLRLIQYLGIAVGIGIAAPLVADYYLDPRLTRVLIVLAIAHGVQAFQGMGPVLLQKEMRFAREVGFFMSRRLIGFSVTLVLAWWLQSYWALVLGALTASIAGVILSYVVYPMMPAVSLTSWRIFTGASVWMTLRSFCAYSNEQVDKLVVGKREGAGVLGAYSLADQIAQMPSSELIGPMARALLPAYSAIKDDLVRLRETFLRALGVQATIGLPAGFGLAVVSQEATSVILGTKWVIASPFIAVLACTYSLHAITNSSSYLLLATGRFRENGLVHATLLILFLLTVLWLAPRALAPDIALVRLMLGALAVMLFLRLATRQLGIGTCMAVALVLFRPVMGTLLMALATIGVGGALHGLSDLSLLVVKVVLGAAVYLIVVLGLWMIQGRPAGAERWLLNLFRAGSHPLGVMPDKSE